MLISSLSEESWPLLPAAFTDSQCCIYALVLMKSYLAAWLARVSACAHEQVIVWSRCASSGIVSYPQPEPAAKRIADVALCVRAVVRLQGPWVWPRPCVHTRAVPALIEAHAQGQARCNLRQCQARTLLPET